MYNNREYNPKHLSSGTTSQIFSGKGIVHAISVNNTSSTAFSVYDGIASTSTPIAILKASIVEGTYFLDATVATGLYVTYAAGDYTVLWTKG